MESYCIFGISITRPSVRNSVRYFFTSLGLGDKGVPRLTSRITFFSIVPETRPFLMFWITFPGFYVTIELVQSGSNLVGEFEGGVREGFLPNTAEDGNSGRRLYAPLTTVTAGVRVKF